ncbi:metallophosphoesterase family protein [Rhizobium terrae]|uniref:metallophosphoesterase family protein n=1 Tax=Rhizobium terrae TaxID=2171756 RepID=UPI000E3D6489|nr:metallophosphoesterase [Rhizobium terrae]
MAPVRVALIADIHHGTDKFTKKGSTALALMEEFRRFVAEANPDAVIDLGDRISDVDRETDLRLEREIAEAFRPIVRPVYHICGNHDRNWLSVAENEEIFGQPLGHRTIDLGGWRIVLWSADTLVRTDGFKLSEGDFIWLAGVVRSADRPLAIMSHVPVSGHAQESNYYFERNPQFSCYPNADRVRALLRAATIPVVWFSGHVHWNTVTMVDGIPHVTVQSLTETFTCHPEPAGTWGLLELDDKVTWEAFGRDPFRFGIDAAATARRWVAPLPSFLDVPEIRSEVEFKR